MTANHSRHSLLRRASAVFAPAALLYAGLSFAAPVIADAAVVYCTGPGYPRGCVVRTAPVVAPAARAVIHCTRPGYPVGCVGGVGGANARAVARPGPGVNLNGGVNRAGLR
ncbi:hypothetical protein [Ancylobacter pratisalsi]|uniref:hypothetical protein n=1 Tax=Ancylobacter pratisalsi TaxID=1745854 RepID=UPI001FE579A5|nr:hypothetical protein [Ancylobacter pratisalsi]